MQTQIVNPYEILQQRRKLKQWKKTTAIQCMKILKKVREMNLESKMLIATELPRTLIYVANRTRDSENQDVKKMNKMCRYLAKEWRKQLGVAEEKKEDAEKKEETKQKVQANQNQNGAKIEKIEEEKKE